MTGQLVIVVGIDGAGKSTVVRQLGRRGYITSHWRELRQVSAEWADLVDHAPETMSNRRGKDRTAFVLELMRGEWRHGIWPRLAADQDVVCDGFYLRPMVKERIFGDGDCAALEQASPLSGDELVLVIDVPVDVAVARKRGQQITAYECFTGPADFPIFQARQREHLLEVARSWRHVVVDGTRSEQDVLEEVNQVLVEHAIRPGSSGERPIQMRGGDR
jgi:thymidylate kinase